MHRVLVTGGQGFLGGWVVRALLARDLDVVVLSRGPRARSFLALERLEERCTMVPGELTDPASLHRAVAGCDTVIHLAAQPIVAVADSSPVPTLEANVAGTWHLLDACLRHDVERVVVAGSDRAYDAQAPIPRSERAPLGADGVYGVSKACVDLVARSYANVYGLPVAVTRVANVYGGGDRNTSRLVPELIAAALAGRPPRLRSDGTAERDFLFAQDAAQVYLDLCDAVDRGLARGEAFNAGGDRLHEVRDVVAAVLEITGSDVRPRYSPADPPDRYWTDSTKLRDATGWRPRVALRDGLERTVAWYRAHPEVLA